MKESKAIYIGVLTILTTLLILGYIPGLRGVSSLVTPPISLFAGLVFALIWGQPYPSFNKKVSKKLLQYSVVGLGFGMNLHESLASSKEGMMLTIVSVVGTMMVGMLIGYKFLKINKNTAYLISCGTAICGGSAIAAHDTSSVVGAGAAYGDEALEVATTIKLTRALWIIPLALVTSVIFKGDSKKISIPYFILWFIVAILINTYLLGDVPEIGNTISGIARKALTLTMFFIGASLSTDVICRQHLRLSDCRRM